MPQFTDEEVEQLARALAEGPKLQFKEPQRVNLDLTLSAEEFEEFCRAITNDEYLELRIDGEVQLDSKGEPIQYTPFYKMRGKGSSSVMCLVLINDADPENSFCRLYGKTNAESDWTELELDENVTWRSADVDALLEVLVA